MKIYIKLAILCCFLFTFGCATKAYVKEQIAPLQNCCDKADKASQKCEKIFNLHQTK
jgi:hypothetical protein